MNESQPDPQAAVGLHPFEHEPAPPEERKLVRNPGVVVRGAGLGVLTAGLVSVAAIAVRKFGWIATPAALIAGASAVLSAWAALIHLTGGEKFDDHRWI